MKVGVRRGAPPIKISFILMLTLVVRLTSGKISVDILKYLATYFDLHDTETGIPIPQINRLRIEKKYNDGRDISQATGVTLKQVAQVLISVEEGSAIIRHGQICDMTDQDFVDSLYSASWNDKPFEETYNHFVKLDNSNKKFCNFFAYLRCQHTSKDPVNPHQCLCPSEMIWQDNKCVFKTGERCSIGSRPLHGEIYKVIPAFDFITDNFIRSVPSKCQNPSTCRHGKSDTCEVDEDFDYYSTPNDLSIFLRGHIDAAIRDKLSYAENGPKRSALTRILREITDRSKQPFYRALSLEEKTSKKLKEHGKPCDSVLDAPIEALLKNYNARDSPDSWKSKDITRDTLRIQYNKRILDDKIDVCNHFKLLRCTSSTPATCDCKDNLVYDSVTKACTVKHSFLCSHYESKLFKPDKTGLLNSPPSFYTYKKISCASGTGCERIGNIGSFCIKSGTDLVDMFSTQLDFEKKFSIEVDGACSVSDQTELFEAAKTFDESSNKNFNDAKTAIQGLTTKSNGYCRIRQHAVCAPEGKCACIPPTKRITPSGSTNPNPRCALPNNYRCNKVHKSQLHLDLEKLNLPLDKIDEMRILASNEVLCVPDSTCEPNLDPHSPLPGHFCTCSLDEKFGGLCDKDPSPHLAHLSVNYLPADMRTLEGLKIISDLHDPLTQLEAAMTLKYEDTCDNQTNWEFVSVMDFLNTVRVACYCIWELNSTMKTNGSWACSNETCGKNDSMFQKPMFESVLQNATALSSKSPLALCNWNQALRCLKDKCGCNEDTYYEHHECRAELGSPCHISFKMDEVPMAICRDGLQCSAPQNITHKRMCLFEPCDNYTKSCFDMTTAEYVSHVKNTLKARLNEVKPEFAKFQKLGWNESCNPADEKVFNEILVELEEYTKEEKKKDSNRNDDSYEDGDDPKSLQRIETDRQDVRLYQGVIKKLEDYSKTDVCHILFKCSAKTNKCFRDKRKYTPYFATGPTRFLDISALLLDFVVFNLVYFYVLH